MYVRKEQDCMVSAKDSQWYKSVKQNMGPGDYLKIYRQNAGLSQTELGQKLGRFTRQHISGMEKGSRGISKDTARELAVFFKVSAERFL